MSIYVRQSEWVAVASWVYEHFDRMTGVSFFPYDDHTYRQAPYEAITKEAYEDAAKGFPSHLNLEIQESYDGTTSSQELACTSGVCEL